MRGGFVPVAARAPGEGSSARGPRTARALAGAGLGQPNWGLIGVFCSVVPFGAVGTRAGAASVAGGDSAKAAMPAGR